MSVDSSFIDKKSSFEDFLKRKRSIDQIRTKEEIQIQMNNEKRSQMIEIYKKSYRFIGEEFRKDFIHFINKNYGDCNKGEIDSYIKSDMKERQNIKVIHHKTKEEILKSKVKAIQNKMSRVSSPIERHKKMIKFSKKYEGIKI